MLATLRSVDEALDYTETIVMELEQTRKYSKVSLLEEKRETDSKDGKNDFHLESPSKSRYWAHCD